MAKQCRHASALAAALGAAVLLACPAALAAPGDASSAHTAASVALPEVHELPGGVWVTGQVTPAQLRAWHQRGAAGVVVIRPDGESPGQPGSRLMAQTAAALGMHFAYAPVAPGTMPAAASVATLRTALDASPRPLLIYCKSGHRAARTWALAEAARPDGLDAAAIEAAVRSAGQSADDLDAEIRRRVRARTASAPR